MIMVITAEKKEKNYRGFKSGILQLKVGDYKEAVEELYKALGINNRTSFVAYRDGRTVPKTTQAEAVESVFNRFGVTNNIWGV